MKSSTIKGAIVKLRFHKNILFHLLYRSKDIYFWLPYKAVLDKENTYRILGPSKRFPYANVWFEIKTDSEIYKQGLNDFVYRQSLIRKATHELRTSSIFLASELNILRKRAIIKILNNHVFKTN
jgi:hypothetical protein